MLQDSDLEILNNIHPELALVAGSIIYSKGYPDSDAQFDHDIWAIQWSTYQYDSDIIDSLRNIAGFCLRLLMEIHNVKYAK